MASSSNVDEWDKQYTSLHFVKGCNEKWASLCSCACLPLWNSGSLMSLPVSVLMSFVKDNYGLLDERVSLCGPLVDGAFLTFPVHFGWPIPDVGVVGIQTVVAWMLSVQSHLLIHLPKCTWGGGWGIYWKELNLKHEHVLFMSLY